MKPPLPAISKSIQKLHWHLPASTLLLASLVILFIGFPLWSVGAQEPVVPGEPPVAQPPGQIELRPSTRPNSNDFDNQVYLPLILKPSAFAVNPQIHANRSAFTINNMS